jgi:hypothetical protein
MVDTIQATQAREGIETTREQADKAYYIVTEGEVAAFFNLEKYRGSQTESDRRNEMFIRSLRDETDSVRTDISRSDFAAIEGSPLAYSRVGLVSNTFRENVSLEPAFGIARQGKATGDDLRWTREHWEIRRGTGWVPFAKGGEYSRFYQDVHLVIDWKPEHRDALRSSGNALPSLDLYFQKGLTWPLRTAKGFNVRRLPPGCVFGHKGPAIFVRKAEFEDYLLGVMNSHLAEFLLRTLTSFSWEVGVIKRLPIPQPTKYQLERISSIARQIYDEKASWDRGNEISTSFERPWLLRDDLVDVALPISDRLDTIEVLEAQATTRIQELHATLNDETYSLYGIQKKSRDVIHAISGQRPPELIWPQMENKDSGQKRSEHLYRLLSYIVKSVVEENEDGIVPFIPISDEMSLVDRVHHRLESLFPHQEVAQVETQVVNELKRRVKGYKRVESLVEWLENVFFDYHSSLYEKRPIIWHIASKPVGEGPAAFSALVDYHKFDKNGMAKLRGRYLRDAIALFRREAGIASKEGRKEDHLEWQARLEETADLDERLRLIQEGHHEGKNEGENDFRILTPWKSVDKRPKGWDPDIDDGVRVNIQPLQRARVLRIQKVV